MKIAVSYKDGSIYEHFGHSELFAIYDYGETVDCCSKYLIDCSDKHGHKDMADLMKAEGVDAVIAGSMGAEAKALLLSYGIVPVAGYMGEADIAADLLASGNLPIDPDGGSCGGGCGGCGGSCHHDDDGECACGCEGCH